MNYSAIYLAVSCVLCLLAPSVFLGLGWIASQNEKINQGKE